MALPFLIPQHLSISCSSRGASTEDWSGVEAGWLKLNASL